MSPSHLLPTPPSGLRMNVGLDKIINCPPRYVHIQARLGPMSNTIEDRPVPGAATEFLRYDVISRCGAEILRLRVNVLSQSRDYVADRVALLTDALRNLQGRYRRARPARAPYRTARKCRCRSQERSFSSLDSR